MTPVTLRSAGLRPALERLLKRHDLDADEARDALFALTESAESEVLKAAFLVALRAKGETAEECLGFARGMLARARGPIRRRADPLVDTCGTGGDGTGSFNLSTAAALLLAALGIPVAKHGNRAVSSRAGSADLLEALGVPFPADPEAAERSLSELGFAFLFAPAFHPAAAAVAPLRRSLGVRTVFNLLGPLVNPARPTHQLVGCYGRTSAPLLAEVLMRLGTERAFVVHGEAGFDEATPVGPFFLFEASACGVREHQLDPRGFGFERCRPDDLAGGNAGENAARLRALFRGERGPLRDALCLNAALVLLLLGREHDPFAAARAAMDALDDGRARRFLERLAEGAA